MNENTQIIKRKYRMIPDDEFISAVKTSFNVAEVIRTLNIKYTGGSHSHFSRRIRKMGLDTQHFTGQASNKGKTYSKVAASDILVLRSSGHRTKTNMLVRAMLEFGIEYKCSNSLCGIGGEWLCNPISLQVDHINRNWLDDQLENLRFLCPNCHSQTEGWCGRNNNDEIKKKKNYHNLCQCGKSKRIESLRCQLCEQKDRKNRKSIIWPSYDSLKQLTDEIGITKTALQLNVSRATLSRKLKKEYSIDATSSIFQCVQCHTPFEMSSKKQKYCSTLCCSLDKRKCQRPNKEEMIKLLTEKSSTQLAKELGVSETAIRKWCKNYEIDYSHRRYKNKCNSRVDGT